MTEDTIIAALAPHALACGVDPTRLGQFALAVSSLGPTPAHWAEAMGGDCTRVAGALGLQAEDLNAMDPAKRFSALETHVQRLRSYIATAKLATETRPPRRRG